MSGTRAGASGGGTDAVPVVTGTSCDRHVDFGGGIVTHLVARGLLRPCTWADGEQSNQAGADKKGWANFMVFLEAG